MKITSFYFLNSAQIYLSSRKRLAAPSSVNEKNEKNEKNEQNANLWTESRGEIEE
jgi:hypothetical protein